MTIEQLLRDNGVPFVSESHQHSTQDWVNIHCPFCPGSKNYHMGIRVEGNACHCWRCGPHGIVETLSKAMGKPVQEVKTLLQTYKTIRPGAQSIEPKVSINPFRYPTPYFGLDERGREYLTRRGFDPDYIEETWNVMQTGPASMLDGTFYQHRLLIPIKWAGDVVSFQTRTMKRKTAGAKYLACPIKREKIHHKNILYGKHQNWREQDAVIVVEGVTDVWRFGPVAAATFGTSFKMEQVLELDARNDRFIIVFDNEPQAQEQARKLAVKLRALGNEVTIETVDTDPGSMSQRRADRLVKRWIGGAIDGP